MVLHAVPVASTVALLDDVAGGGEIGDDAVGTSLGDPERRREISEADAGVVRDTQQDACVVRQKGPLRPHRKIIADDL